MSGKNGNCEQFRGYRHVIPAHDDHPDDDRLTENLSKATKRKVRKVLARR